MNKHLSQLIEISNIDKEIDGFGPRINEINRELNVVLEKKSSLNQQLLELEDDIKDAKLKVQKNEHHLRELNDKIQDLAKKGAQIKTEKEMKALNLEEEIAKEQISFANEEIERHNKIIQAKIDQSSEIKTKIAELESEAKTIEEGVANKLNSIEQEKQKVYEGKNELVSKMDQKIISFYEKIRRWAGNSTVVEVKKQACCGCFIKLNDKVYSEVIRSDDIVSCPHCGRILYIKPEVEIKG